jgi:hypothetical protein
VHEERILPEPSAYRLPCEQDRTPRRENEASLLSMAVSGRVEAEAVALA